MTKTSRRRRQPSPTAEPPSGATSDCAHALTRLKADPSLRFTEGGRTLLRLLGVWSISPPQWDLLAGSIPPHCRVLVAELAREISDSWRRFADRLENMYSR